MKHGFKSQTSTALRDSKIASPNKRLLRKDDSPSGQPLRKKAKDAEAPRTSDMFIEGQGHTGEEFTWVDPSTQKVFVIDSRTGNSYAVEDERQTPDSRGTTRRTLNTSRAGSCAAETPDWIRRALGANEVFASAEGVIKSASSSTPQCCMPSEAERQSSMRIPWTKQFNQAFSTAPEARHTAAAPAVSSFSKRSLANAQVLRQVDSKFIACLLDTYIDGEESTEEDSRTLVLIDQHAADERIRVERFLKAMCLGYLDRHRGGSVERRTLDKPVSVTLTKFERDRLVRSGYMKESFENWSFVLSVEQPPDNLTESDAACAVVNFKTVPEVVADKVRPC